MYTTLTDRHDHAANTLDLLFTANTQNYTYTVSSPLRSSDHCTVSVTSSFTPPPPDRLILPDSRALGTGLPGLPGSWSLELLPPSRSGCVQLPLPLLFITPFAILVFPRENFVYEGVGGVFGS